MSYNITRILMISALTQGLAWTACATETRPGFYNAEEDDDRPILTVNFTNRKTDSDSTATQNGVTTKQTSNITADAVGFAFSSANNSGFVYSFGHNLQNSPTGKLETTHIGLNYHLSNDLTQVGVRAEHIEHPTMSEFQGLHLNASHEIEYGTGELSVYGTQSFVFNNSPHNEDGSNGSSFGLNFHVDDDRIANTASASFAKSKVASYSSFTRQTTVWWREETTFSGTTLRKFINHRIGIRGHYKLMDDPLLSDQIDGRLIWIFEQRDWQTKSELFWTKQKYKSDSTNIRGDENTFGASLGYVRQIDKNITFNVDATFSEGSKSSRHPNPVNTSEATSKTIAQNTVISIGLNYQF